MADEGRAIITMTGITEAEIYEAFGLGAQEQEPADPAADAQEEPAAGAQEQELAAPARRTGEADTGTQTEPTAGAAETDEDSGTGDGGDVMTPEQRRANAARRRQQEQERQQAAMDQAVQAAVNAAEERHKADMERFFAQAGLKNTITGEPITNMEQFDAWNTAFQEAKLQRELKAGKLTQEGLAAAIGNHPAVKQAQQLAQQQAAARQEQEKAQARARIDAELAEIHKVDASISTLEDLLKAPYGKELYDMTRRGYSIKDAHTLLTRDTLEKATAEAAKQAAINNARGKDHLTATGGSRGGGNVTVPKDILDTYRAFNPGATDAEIQAHYNKTLKK